MFLFVKYVLCIITKNKLSYKKKYLKDVWYSNKSVKLTSKDKEHRQRLTVCSVCSSDAQREHLIRFLVGILFHEHFELLIALLSSAEPFFCLFVTAFAA